MKGLRAALQAWYVPVSTTFREHGRLCRRTARSVARSSDARGVVWVLFPRPIKAARKIKRKKQSQVLVASMSLPASRVIRDRGHPAWSGRPSSNCFAQRPGTDDGHIQSASPPTLYTPASPMYAPLSRGRCRNREYTAFAVFGYTVE